MSRHLALTIVLFWGMAACASPGSTAAPQRSSMDFDPAVYPESMGGLVTHFGISQMVTDDWDPLDNPSYIGVGYQQHTGWDPVEVELGFNYNHETLGGGATPEQRLRFFVFDLGLSMAVPLTRSKANVIEPYAGGGLSFLYARRDEEVGFDIDHFQDGDQGYYFHAGIRIHINPTSYISLDARWLRDVEVDLGGGLQSAESDTLSVGFGYSF